ncbi:MAG: ribosome maturation factor RimM, partial [Fusobacteriaceae bacterium]
GGTHHLKGAVKIHSNIGDALKSVEGQKVMIELSPENIKMVTVKSVAPLVGDRWIMEFEEITNKTDAGKLTKGFIKARRDLLGIGEDEYLMNDLLEMQVITEEGRDIGKVMNIFETAAHEILEVESETTEAMIPNIAEFVKEIDFEKGIIRVALIDGMLEEKK